ncbi:MAG: hybrid sensor histidine kinase/response regulator [Rickettsiales bacterium]|nr:hybrid sensor histidine kinase/response regulator [Pseudomonadota bacterium]MDA0965657.1 hybrid sensor histidine kinase/response regulator [Pseudomonadota bacterium]MDG4542981.1 hybrid sensor histidine kinase/response regulator [Rickettsiales bacterium]MDG4544571.1 hybrid sensor histidine kinase/response regulator [Rickettsiales bacterium]MDG4546693.1 hybrid sensor histidine kinase/response regulator [Rickettsiales bacterium]
MKDIEDISIKDAAILVVDDNEANRDILIRKFERIGINCLSAEGGKEAIEIIDRNRVDMVFLDLMMPDVSGFDVLQYVRKQYQPWQLPIIIVTAKNDTESILEAYKLGASDFISKPVNFSVAKARAKNCFMNKKLHEEISTINSSLEQTVNEKTQTLKHLVDELESEVQRCRAVEKDLIEQKGKVEVANKAKNDFLSNMTHELRTPLSSIIGFTDIIRKGKVTNRMPEESEELGSRYEENFKEKYGDCNEYIDFIHNAATELFELINNVFEMSEIESDNLRLQEANTSIEKIVDKVVISINKTIENSGMEIPVEVDITNKDAVIFVDKHRIEKVLLHLLSNSVKFSLAGGVIKINADVKDDDGIYFVVEDNGIGLSEENVDTVMEPFTQLDGSRDRKYGGIGLGLSLANALTEKHEGKLTIEGAEGRGTKVTVWLPSSRIVKNTLSQGI